MRRTSENSTDVRLADRRTVTPWCSQVFYMLALAALSITPCQAMTVEEFRSLPDTRIAIRTSQGVRSARPLSATQIEVTLGMTATAVAKQPLAYRVISHDDSNYAYEKFVTPTAAKMNKTAELRGVAGGAFAEYHRTVVTLDLPTRIQGGHTYHVLAQGLGRAMITSTHAAAEFVYEAGKIPPVPDNDIDLAILGLRRVEPVGPSLILLEFGPDLAPGPGSKTLNYTVTLNGRRVDVTALGRRTMVDTYIPVGWPFTAIPEHQIFLELATPFSDGDHVEVRPSETITAAGSSASFLFDARTTLSNSIKVNQVGYLASASTKHAYLGRWMGSFPEGGKSAPEGANAVATEATSVDGKFTEALLAAVNQTEEVFGAAPREGAAEPSGANPSLLFENEPVFRVCHAASGKEALRGTAELVHTSGERNEGYHQIDHSGENVYEIDFSALTRPGQYFISVPGVGRSLTFTVSDLAYEEAFKIMGHGLFTQRCGIELGPPYTEWRRIACHKKGVTPTTLSRLEGEHVAFKDLPKRVDYDRVKDAPIDPALLALNQDADLLAYWPLNGDLEDASGNGYDLRPITPSVTFARETQIMPGKNQVFGPTRSDANGLAAYGIPFDTKRGFTISAWVRFPGGIKFGGIVLGHHKEKWNSPGLGIKAIYGVLNGSAGVRGDSLKVGRLSDGKWHHVALTVPPSGSADDMAAMYVDGELRATGVAKSEIQGTSFRIAALDNDQADGKYMDDVRIYKRVLAPADIATLATKWGERAVALMIHGGHHDAGDYNPRSHLDVAWTLMNAYEIAPGKYHDGQLAIPENSNGIPDLVDEALWALRLWIGLQDVDGGVFNGTESNGDPNFIQTVELDPLGDYAFKKDAWGSYKFAATMAQASRILQSLGRKESARTYLERAERAYTWAEQHPDVHADPGDHARAYLDPRAYASAELLHTTGEKKYQDDFASVCVWSRRADAGIEKYQLYSQKLAAWAYAKCPATSVDADLQKIVKEQIVNWADWKIEHSQTMGYGFARHPHAPITWGTGAQLSWVPVLTWAHTLTGDEKYRTWIIRSCDNTLGANPLNLSWITGLGTRTVRAPLHNSHWSHLGEVVAGQQAQGPNARGDGYRVTEVAYPKIRADFAPLYTFCDNHFCIAMDEGASKAQAENLAVFGFLLPDRE